MDNNKLVVEEFIVKKALPLTQDERKRTGK